MTSGLTVRKQADSNPTRAQKCNKPLVSSELTLNNAVRKLIGQIKAMGIFIRTNGLVFPKINGMKKNIFLRGWEGGRPSEYKRLKNKF